MQPSFSSLPHLRYSFHFSSIPSLSSLFHLHMSSSSLLPSLLDILKFGLEARWTDQSSTLQYFIREETRISELNPRMRRLKSQMRELPPCFLLSHAAVVVFVMSSSCSITASTSRLEMGKITPCCTSLFHCPRTSVKALIQIWQAG